MTVAEEVGLEGANGLDPVARHGSILINLDSEEDGSLTVGCAGSTDTWIRIAAPREPVDDGARDARGRATGGLGGHSGTNIEHGRANAIKVVGRALREASDDRAVPARLARRAARAATRSRATPWRSARSRATARGASATPIAAAAATIAAAYAVSDPGVTVDGAQPADARAMPGRRPRRRGCSTPSRSSRAARSP